MLDLRRPLTAASFALVARFALANPIELYPPGGQTATLSAIKDTRLQSHTPWLNDGHSILSTYMKEHNLQDTLIQFDLGGLPSGEPILQATLRLYGMPWEPAADTETHLYRVTGPWEEYEAAWNFASFGRDWIHPGGDFVGRTGQQATDPYATVSGPSVMGWYEWDATAIVREWQSGLSPNYGFALAGPMSNRLVYVSREGRFEIGGYEGNRPELVVRYGAVPEPTTLVLGALAAVAAFRRPR